MHPAASTDEKKPHSHGLKLSRIHIFGLLIHLIVGKRTISAEDAAQLHREEKTTAADTSVTPKKTKWKSLFTNHKLILISHR